MAKGKHLKSQNYRINVVQTFFSVSGHNMVKSYCDMLAGQSPQTAAPWFVLKYTTKKAEERSEVKATGKERRVNARPGPQTVDQFLFLKRKEKRFK